MSKTIRFVYFSYICTRRSFLFDHVSRAHEVKIRQLLSLCLLRGFLSNFSCCFPWTIRADLFEFPPPPPKKEDIFQFFCVWIFNYTCLTQHSISRAREIEIRHSSVRRPSACGIDYL